MIKLSKISVNSVAISNTQHIYDLVGICAQYGVQKAVVCPGSRCAPLLIGFGKHPDIETISITDERSAGFIALGLAQQSDRPVVLVCTSGTAVQNFAPAVTEAFYQNVPLIVLTADRPPEWIDQWDGQTIHQENLYKPHVKSSFNYDENNVNVGEEALTLASDGAKGPVHLNIPIREPFYSDSIDEISFATKGTRLRFTTNGQALRTNGGQAKFTKEKKYEIEGSVWDEFESILNQSEKVMVLGGQLEPNQELVNLINQLDMPIVGDVISNLHGVNDVIQSSDLIFKNRTATKGAEYTKDEKKLRPDFLITFGRSVISNNLKLFFRKHKPIIHWHIGTGMVGDPFQSLTKRIETTPLDFFRELIKMGIATKDAEITKTYSNLLTETQMVVDKDFNTILDESEFNYFSAVRKVLKQLPENSVLHLGNSMPVRIANFIGIDDSSVDVWCNRGTSGIDGVLSTAVGHALAEPNRKHTLIVGDLSFFYDRNGLWLNHEFPTNLQIVVLNDSGGGIFNMIPGPSNQVGLTKLFTTPHNRTAELTAKEFGLNYQSATSLDEIKEWGSGILEIFTNMNINKETFNKIATKGTRITK